MTKSILMALLVLSASNNVFAREYERGFRGEFFSSRPKVVVAQTQPQSNESTATAEANNSALPDQAGVSNCKKPCC